MLKTQVIIAQRTLAKLQHVRVEWRDPGPVKSARTWDLPLEDPDGDRRRECSMHAAASGLAGFAWLHSARTGALAAE